MAIRRPCPEKDIVARGKMQLRKIEGKRGMQQRGHKYV
jgi:hypothetical protein